MCCEVGGLWLVNALVNSLCCSFEVEMKLVYFLATQFPFFWCLFISRSCFWGTEKLK